MCVCGCYLIISVLGFGIRVGPHSHFDAAGLALEYTPHLGALPEIELGLEVIHELETQEMLRPDVALVKDDFPKISSELAVDLRYL